MIMLLSCDEEVHIFHFGPKDAPVELSRRRLPTMDFSRKKRRPTGLGASHPPASKRPEKKWVTHGTFPYELSCPR